MTVVDDRSAYTLDAGHTCWTYTYSTTYHGQWRLNMVADRVCIWSGSWQATVSVSQCCRDMVIYQTKIVIVQETWQWALSYQDCL